MTLDSFLRVGETVTLGSHTFGADEIKRFAAQYDPQRFHVDEEAARHSVFGRLCASGWHTCAMWMRYNLATREDGGETGGPTFGPSPGFSNLRWLKPVYAGDTITYTRTVTGHRPLASRPGWHIATVEAGGVNQDGAPVLFFENAVLVKAG